MASTDKSIAKSTPATSPAPTSNGTDADAVLSFVRGYKRHPKTAPAALPSKVASALNRACKVGEGVYAGPLANGGQFWTGPELLAFCKARGCDIG